MSRRTLFILLFISLAVNLFVIGAAAGAFLFGARLHGRMAVPRGAPVMLAAAAALPDDQKEAYRQTLRAEAGVVGPKLREAHQLRRQAWMRLGTDPLDAKGIAADLDRARALETEARAEVDHTILDFSARLAAPDRARLGQALGQPPRRGPRPPPP